MVMTDLTTEPRYSLSEIDRMRNALKVLLAPSRTDVFYGGSEEPAYRTVEDHLRTYMMNGTKPGELESLAKEKLGWLAYRSTTVNKLWREAPMNSRVAIPAELDEWVPGKKAPLGYFGDNT